MAQEPKEKPVTTLLWIIENCTVHQLADDYPRLSPEELQTLANDIEANGLLEPITLYMDDAGAYWIIDGVNRLEAYELIPEDRRPTGPVPVTWLECDLEDLETYIDSKNLHRRHLSKEQYVKRIAKRLGIDLSTDKVTVTASVKDEKGQLQGTTKNPDRAKLVEEAAKAGISEETVKKTISKARGTLAPRVSTPRPPRVTLPEPEPVTVLEVKPLLQQLKEKQQQQPAPVQPQQPVQGPQPKPEPKTCPTCGRPL